MFSSELPASVARPGAPTAVRSDSSAALSPGPLASAERPVANARARVDQKPEKGDLAPAVNVKVGERPMGVGQGEPPRPKASDLHRTAGFAQETLAQNLSVQTSWAVGGFALCCALLGFGLLYAVRSQRRYKTAADARLIAIAAMEQDLVARHRLLRLINHEACSPLQTIAAAAELLARKENHADSIAAIRRIRHAVMVLQGQMRDLLTIARSDSAQLPPQVEPFELCELVQDVCAGLEEVAAAKGLTFEVECPPSPVTVIADPVRIAQVLRNLVDNAVRYTSVGRVRVRAEPFVPFRRDKPIPAVIRDLQNSGAAGALSTEGTLRFVVEDSGAGLPSLAAERLGSGAVAFEPSSDGSGIGLFVVREVLQQLGGRIELRTRVASDREGTGTTLTVSIPARWVPDDSSPDDPEEMSHPLNVLLVDGWSEGQDRVGDAARRLGHVWRTAGSADEARSLLSCQSFDVILIGLVMPCQRCAGTAPIRR